MMLQIKVIKKVIFAAMAIVMLYISPLYALMTPTHKILNEYIASTEINGFDLDSYLKNILGLNKGIEQPILSKEVYQWLILGGKTEDSFPRFLNHFHDPITNNGLLSVNDSAVEWAFKYPEQQSWLTGNFSWKDARQYFYNALTFFPTGINPVFTESCRQENFADTFRALGQRMHLVEDMSVPAHARNDAHIVDDKILTKYEKWLARGNITLHSNYFRLSNCENL